MTKLTFEHFYIAGTSDILVDFISFCVVIFEIFFSRVLRNEFVICLFFKRLLICTNVLLFVWSKRRSVSIFVDRFGRVHFIKGFGKMSSTIVRKLLIIFMILFFVAVEAPCLRHGFTNSTAQVQARNVETQEVDDVAIQLKLLKIMELKLKDEESRLEQVKEQLRKTESRLREQEQAFRIKEALFLEINFFRINYN